MQYLQIVRPVARSRLRRSRLRARFSGGGCGGRRGSRRRRSPRRASARRDARSSARTRSRARSARRARTSGHAASAWSRSSCSAPGQCHAAKAARERRSITVASSAICVDLELGDARCSRSSARRSSTRALGDRALEQRGIEVRLLGRDDRERATPSPVASAPSRSTRRRPPRAPRCRSARRARMISSLFAPTSGRRIGSEVAARDHARDSGASATTPGRPRRP